MSQSGPASAAGGGTGIITIDGNSGSVTGSTVSVVGTGGVSTSGSGTTLTISSSGTGALILLQTQTAASVTSLAFTTGISSTYNNYLLIGTNITNPAFGGDFFGAQISTNGGSSYITSGYSNQYSPGTVMGICNPTTTTNISCNITINNLTSGAGNIFCSGVIGIYNSSIPGCDSSSNDGGGYNTANVTANAFRLVADDGTAFSGTFSLYGYVM